MTGAVISFHAASNHNSNLTSPPPPNATVPNPRSKQRTLQGELSRTAAVTSTIAEKLEAQRTATTAAEERADGVERERAALAR